MTKDTVNNSKYVTNVKKKLGNMLIFLIFNDKEKFEGLRVRVQGSEYSVLGPRNVDSQVTCRYYS